MARTAEQIEEFFASVLSVPAHSAFGLGLVRWAPGEAVLDFTASGPCLGPRGEVHGGVVSLLLEPAAMFAAVSQLPADQYAVTIDIHVQQLRAIRPGARVELTSRVVRLARQWAFCEAVAMDEDRLCASARITKAVVAAG